MSKFDEILNSSDASDALLGEQIDKLQTKLDANTIKYEVFSAAVTSLDTIPINTMGSCTLNSTISPSGGTTTMMYNCYGHKANDIRVLFMSRPYTKETWINYKIDGAWSGWNKLNTTAV